MTTQSFVPVNRVANDTFVRREEFTTADYLRELRRGDKGEGRTPQSDARDKLAVDFRVKVEAEIGKETWLATMTSPPSANNLVWHYMQDVTALNKCWREFNCFLWNLVRPHITVLRPQDGIAGDRDGSMLNQVITNTTYSFANNAVNAWRAELSSMLSANLSGMPTEEMFVVCKNDILEKVAQVANYVACHHLGEGMERGVYGLHYWPSESSCWYVRNEYELRMKSTRTEFLDINRATVDTNNDIWMACHEVHLMDAELQPGLPWNLDWPPAIWAVMEKLPRFLKPFVNTVVGTMIKKRVIKWHMGTMSYTSDVVAPLPAPVIDPAVVIGPIVLTGWENDTHRRPFWWRVAQRLGVTRPGS